MLCIPQHTVEAAHSDICGSLFEKVIIYFSYIFLYSSRSPGSHRTVLFFF